MKPNLIPFRSAQSLDIAVLALEPLMLVNTAQVFVIDERYFAISEFYLSHGSIEPKA
jgi:hypothetical protein